MKMYTEQSVAKPFSDNYVLRNKEVSWITFFPSVVNFA